MDSFNQIHPPKVAPPYGTILDELRAGDAIPFLGAWASRVGWSKGAPDFLPSGGDLAEMLARDSRFPSADDHDIQDLAKVASYYADGSSRIALRRRLRGVFTGAPHASNDLHRMLAQIANNLMIVTTNYDTLLEQAFQEAGKPYDLAVYPADNTTYGNALLWWPHGALKPQPIRANDFDIADLSRTNIIYKIHGSVRHEEASWDSFVITEEDYVKFLSQMSTAVPPAFRQYFSSRAFLFLGYGLRDWNMRVLLKQVKEFKKKTESEKVSWAILKEPSIFETKLWLRRNVDMFDLTLEEFVGEMRLEIGRR